MDLQTDVATTWASPLVLLPFVYAYLSVAFGAVVANFQAIFMSALAIALIFVWDMYGSTKRRLNQSQNQSEFFVEVLRRVNPLSTGESNMSKDIDRLLGGRLFSYAEIKRISARLIKSELDHLVSIKKLSSSDRDIVAEQLALQCNLWELYPKKKPAAIPDAKEVKDAIKARILRVAPSAIDPVPIPGVKEEPPARGFDRLLRRKVA